MKKFRANYIPFPKTYEKNEEPSLTKQSFKDECDLNLMMARYEKTGLLPQMIQKEPQYGDFSSVPDYHEACNVVLKADTQFASLPASTRDQFHNNPEKFLEFANNPANAEKMADMGLMTPESVKRVRDAKESKSTASKQHTPDPKPPQNGGNEKGADQKPT